MPEDPELTSYRLRNNRIALIVAGIFGGILALAVLALALTPLANAANVETNLDIQVTVALSVSLAITTAVSIAAAVGYRSSGRYHRKRSRRHQAHILQLQQQVRDLGAEPVQSPEVGRRKRK